MGALYGQCAGEVPIPPGSPKRETAPPSGSSSATDVAPPEKAVAYRGGDPCHDKRYRESLATISNADAVNTSVVEGNDCRSIAPNGSEPRNAAKAILTKAYGV